MPGARCCPSPRPRRPRECAAATFVGFSTRASSPTRTWSRAHNGEARGTSPSPTCSPPGSGCTRRQPTTTRPRTGIGAASTECAAESIEEQVRAETAAAEASDVLQLQANLEDAEREVDRLRRQLDEERTRRQAADAVAEERARALETAESDVSARDPAVRRPDNHAERRGTRGRPTTSWSSTKNARTDDWPRRSPRIERPRW